MFVASLVTSVGSRVLAQESTVPNDDRVATLVTEASEARAGRRWDESLRAIDRAIALAPSRASLHVERAVTLAWSGRLAEALAAYRDALALDPGLVAARCGEARILGWLGHTRAALALGRAAARSSPDDVEARLTVADLHRLRLETRLARAGYRSVLATVPGQPGAAEGLRALAILRPRTVGASFAATSAAGRMVYGGAAWARVNLRPNVKLDARYEASAVAIAPIDPALRSSQLGQRVDAGLAYGVNERLTLEARYEWVRGATDAHRVGGRLSVRASPRLVLLGGTRATVSRVGRSDLIGDVGALVPFGESFAMIQVFGSNSPRQRVWTSASVVATGRVDLGGRFAARASVSYARLVFGATVGASARFEVQASRAVRAFVAGEWNGLALERWATTVGMEISR